MNHKELVSYLFSELPNIRVISVEAIDYLMYMNSERRKKVIQTLKESNHTTILSEKIGARYHIDSNGFRNVSASLGKILYSMIFFSSSEILSGLRRECSLPSTYYIIQNKEIIKKTIPFDLEKAYDIMYLIDRVSTDIEMSYIILSEIESYTEHLLGINPIPKISISDLRSSL